MTFEKQALYSISIFAQVNITNPTPWLVKFDVLKDVIFQMAASHFVEVYW
jgi:hypothetical protein